MLEITAGTFGGITCNRLSAGNSSLSIKPISFHLQSPRSLQITYLIVSHRSRVLAMAEQNPLTNSSEIEEPSPEFQMIEQNGVHGTPNLVVSPFLKVKKLSDKAVLPSRASPFAGGYDLSSAGDVKVPAMGKALVPTDLSIAIPKGTYAFIAPRSGMAWRHSIIVGGDAIDADYRAPVEVILINHSDVDLDVKVGDRIAQLIIQVIITPDVVEVENLDSTARGAGGFGSTGI